MRAAFGKRIAVVILGCLMCLSLTACGLSTMASNELNSDVDERVKANYKVAENLYDSGLITETARDSYLKTIEENYKNIKDLANTGLFSSNNLKTLMNCVVDYHVVTLEDLQYYGLVRKVYDPATSKFLYWEDEFGLLENNEVENAKVNNSEFLSNFLADKASSYWNSSSIVKGSGDTGFITILADTATTNINSSMNWTISVLQENAFNSEDTLIDLYNELQEVKNCKNTSDTTDSGKKVLEVMNGYFQDLKDAKGNSVRLVDNNDEQYKIIQQSSGVSDLHGTYSTSTTADKKYTITSNGDDGRIEESNYQYNGSNCPGMDLVIHSHGIPVLVIRVCEFNQMAYDNIVQRVGLDKSKYLVLNGAENKAYLVQYPVGYVEGFRLVDSQGNPITTNSIDSSTENYSYEAVIIQSGCTSELGNDHQGLEINLLSGSIIKRNSTLSTEEDSESTTENSDDKDKNKADTEVDKDENGEAIQYTERYIFKTAKSSENCSFVVYGKTGLKEDGGWGLTFGASTTEASIPRIVIRDYLEASYAPDVVSNEELIVYGRMIRIKKFTGSLSDTVAKYVDTNGVELNAEDTAFSFKVYDFADVWKATSTIPYNMHLIENDSAASGVKEVALFENDGSLTAYTEEPTKIDELQELATIEEVTTTVPFPGSMIGVSDKDNVNSTSSKPMFYAMLTNVSPYTTGTILNWVNYDGTTESLRWWNKWLSSHSFVYQIDTNRALGYFAENYKYELSEAGILALDLELIEHIKEIYEEKQAQDVISTFGAITKIIGVFLIVYAVTLCLAWLFDTNISPGIQLLQKITFGKMIAVSDENEMPTVGDEKAVYVGLGSVLKSALIIMVLGIILTLFNALNLIYNIANLIGSITVNFFDLIVKGKT